jgi:hypothetical protein
MPSQELPTLRDDLLCQFYAIQIERIGSPGRFFAEMDRHPAITVVIEHGDEFEASPERLEVLAQGRHPYVVGMLELGDRSLGHIEAPGKLGLADHLGVTEFGKADLLERLNSTSSPAGSSTSLAARTPVHQRPRVMAWTIPSQGSRSRDRFLVALREGSEGPSTFMPGGMT